MADAKITALATGTTLHSDDWLVYVDTHDTTMALSGTDKKLSPAVMTAGLAPFVASGASHAQGVVPDPGSSAGTTKFLREDATWAIPAGGGGSPGGSSGQVQYNNSGVFGGYTMSGDATLVTSTGVITVTKTGGVSFAASATTDTTNAANISSGTLGVARLPVMVASGASHSAGIVPDPGSSAGTTRFLREDATWFVPAGGGGGGSPGGSSGQIQYNNSGAFGGYTMGGDGTLDTSTGTLTIANGAITPAKQSNMSALTLRGNPTGSAAAPSEITLGSGLAFSGGVLRCVPIYQALSSGTAVANTTTKTSLFAGVGTSIGSLTLAANTLQAGTVLRPLFFGTMTVAAGSPTLSMEISLGGQVLFTQTSGALSATSSNLMFMCDSLTFYQVQSTGSSGKIIGVTGFRINHSTATQNVYLAGSSSSAFVAQSAPAQITINTTTGLAFDIKVTWSAANASNSIQLTGGCLYADNY